MKTETAADQVRREMHRVHDNMRAELDRVEILAAALGVFSKPVLDYEPTVRHLRPRDLTLSAHQIDS